MQYNHSNQIQPPVKGIVVETGTVVAMAEKSRIVVKGLVRK